MFRFSNCRNTSVLKIRTNEPKMISVFKMEIQETRCSYETHSDVISSGWISATRLTSRLQCTSTWVPWKDHPIMIYARTVLYFLHPNSLKAVVCKNYFEKCGFSKKKYLHFFYIDKEGSRFKSLSPILFSWIVKLFFCCYIRIIRPLL